MTHVFLKFLLHSGNGFCLYDVLALVHFLLVCDILTCATGWPTEIFTLTRTLYDVFYFP
jgi:hypothetical protein